jgi:hypothetical protein
LTIGNLGEYRFTIGYDTSRADKRSSGLWRLVAALTPICEVGKNAFARQDLHQKGSGTPIHRPSLWQQHIASTSGLTEARPYVVVSVAKVFHNTTIRNHGLHNENDCKLDATQGIRFGRVPTAAIHDGENGLQEL